ncbi:transglutaminase-like domain-containing protein [Mycoplasmopsis caviae]|uniref:Transglutaminase-like domain-containing protein n=1 Tax=Mycoplasmopsis caviae TaxID=55603 RepID=A0A3P8L757_9BACT|nr:transglutaminase-like domain-containing protein [Mycoplasmopsis caviae]UUD35232.1 transglutaminase-like domain-containing protein [Mycoplasmopsis caviae]VDR41985.1 Uncharacterised protein [Mycoplasmopsis caviae]
MKKKTKLFLSNLLIAPLSTSFVFIASCNWKTKGDTFDINKYALNVKFNIPDIKNKMLTDIKGIKDFEILDFNSSNFEITNFKLVKDGFKNNLTIKFNVKDKKTSLISEEQKRNFVGFKNLASLEEVINSIRVSLKSPDFTKSNIEKLQKEAFNVSHYDELIYFLNFDNFIFTKNSVKASISFRFLSNPNKKISKEFDFTIKEEIDNKQSEKQKTNDVLIGVKAVLLNKNEYAKNIVENWKNNGFITLSGLPANISGEIIDVRLKTSDSIEIMYWIKNTKDNIVSDTKTEILNLEAKSSKLVEYKEYIEKNYKGSKSTLPGEYKTGNGWSSSEQNIRWNNYELSSENHNSVFYGSNPNGIEGSINSSYFRKSQIGKDEDEIKELEELFNNLVSNYETSSYNLRSQYFNAKNMTEAMLNWYSNHWADYNYIHTNVSDFSFPNEANWYGSIFNKEINNNLKNHKFFRLFSMEKSWEKWDYDEMISNKKIKELMYEFIKNGINQIQSDMSDIDKIYTLVRYVTDCFTYDFHKEKQPLYTALQTKIAVCHHYATFLALLLNLVGVKAVPISTDELVHKVVAVKVKQDTDDKPKWYFTDCTEFDTPPSASLPSGKFDYTSRERWKIDQLLTNYELSIPNPVKGMKVTNVLNIHLPWDKLNDPSYAGDRNFYGNSIFYQIKKPNNNLNYVEDSSITMYHSKHENGPSRFFYWKNNWYTISNYMKDGKSHIGLFRFQLESTKMKLIKNEIQTFESSDELSNKIVLSENAAGARIFQEKNLLYHFYYKKDATTSTESDYTLKVYDLTKNDSSCCILTKDVSTEASELVLANKKIDFYVKNGEINLYRYNSNLDENTKFDPDVTKKIIMDDKLKNIEEEKTNNELLRKFALARFQFGSYMYSDLSTRSVYLPLNLRKEFDELKSELSQKLNLSTNYHDNNLYSEFSTRIDLLLKKLNEAVKNKWGKLTFYKIDDLQSNINVFNSNLQGLNFKLTDKYWVNDTLNKHFYYDVFFSETKPSDESEMNNASKLVFKGISLKELKSIKLNQFEHNGFLWIKGYFGTEEQNYIFSNVSNIRKTKWEFSSHTKSNLGLHSNISTTFSKSQFYDDDFILETELSFSGDKSKIKSIKAKFYHYYNGNKKLINEKDIDINNLTKLHDNVKSQNKEPGKYFYEFEVEEDNEIYKFNSNEYLSISEQDSINFTPGKYFSS